MNFYIYQNSQWTEVYVEIEPKLSKAWDTTNDNFSCVLQASSSDTPYKPMTPFKIVDDSSQTNIMWIINDSVTTFSLNPATYKHSLSIVQYRYFLNKHLVRNTVFNQPRKKNATLYSSMSNFLNSNDDGDIDYSAFGTPIIYWTDYISLGTKAKVKTAAYEIVLYGTLVDAVAHTADLVKITSTNGINLVVKSSPSFSIIDADTNTTIISDIKINNFGSQKDFTTAQINTLNTYLTNNQGCRLAFVYISGTNSVDPFDNAFVEKENINVTSVYTTITVQISVNFETYNYTMYDILDTLLKQYRLQTDNFGYKRELLFNLPASGDLYDLLTTTYPPDTMTFTQATFYDVLTEIFRFYDAGFKFDENKTLQIEYYNDPQSEVTNFSAHNAGVSINHTDKNYNSGRVNYYQNAINQVKIKEMPTRSYTLGIPGRSDFGIILPYPIYDVTKICYWASFKISMPFNNSGISDGNQVGSISPFPLDFSYFVVNQQEWSVLNNETSPTGKIYNLKQITTIPFERGSKFICTSRYDSNYGGQTAYVLHRVLQGAVCRFYGIVDWQDSTSISFSSQGTEFSPAWSDYKGQKFQIEYVAMNNGRLETKTLNKQYSGEMLVNQGNGIVDLNKLGLNMLGESLKDGEPVLTATHEITNWNDRVKEGDYITYNGSRWLANVVNYSVVADGVYQGTIEFSKNFNALALRVQNDNQKRLTSISSEESLSSEDNYVDYIYVSDDYMMPETETTVLNNRVLESMVGQTFGLSSSYYQGYENVNFAGFVGYQNGSPLSSLLYIPLIKYGAGNCVCFEMQYDSPINAGNQLKVSTGWFGSNAYFSQATPYTDEEGWVDNLSIGFISQDYTFGDFPVINSHSSVGRLLHLKYYKKPNEVFGLNYEWCFLPLPSKRNDFFIGNMFINNNAFTIENYDKKQFYLYDYQGTEEYTILDKFGKGNKISIKLGTEYGANYVRLYILTDTEITTGYWSICDEEGNIYFASNTPHIFNSEISETSAIYFITRRTMVEDDATLTDLPAPTQSGSYHLTVSSTEWVTISDTNTISVLPLPPFVSVDPDSNVSYGTYTYQSLTLIGVAISELAITNTVTGYTNTVSYDSATGTFSGGVYLIDNNPESAQITYKKPGATTRVIYNYDVTIPSLVGANLSSLTISPATVTINGTTFTNTIYFDRTSGRIYGMVNETSAGLESYTINYTVS